MVFQVFCRHFGFAADWENWSENDRMSEGVGGAAVVKQGISKAVSKEFNEYLKSGSML